MYLKLFYIHNYTQEEKKYSFILQFKVTENTNLCKKRKKRSTLLIFGMKTI